MTTTNSLSFFKRFLKFVRTSLVEIKNVLLFHAFEDKFQNVSRTIILCTRESFKRVN